MTKPLSGLNKKLLAAAMNAGRASEGEGPIDDENETDAEDTEDEEEAPPASKKSGKAKSKGKAKAETDDEDTEAEGDDEDSEAEGDDEDVDAEDEDEDSEAEGDDEDVDAEDDEEDQPPASKKKATGERGRIQAILTSPLAAGREDLAQHLAFNTASSPKAAFGILKAAPKAGKAASLRSRMAAEGNPNIKQGSGKGATTEAELVKGAVATIKQFGF